MFYEGAAVEVNDDDLRSSYDAVRPSRVLAADELGAYLIKLLDAAGINYLSVASRAKEVASFVGKAKATDREGNAKYSDPLSQIQDQVALRVITYLPETVQASCDLIEANFEVLERIDKGAQNEERGVFGYASRHFILRLSQDRRAMLEYQHAADLEFEVQVRTTLQHAWAEFEHDVRYKGDIPHELVGKFNRRFALAAGLIELADSQFSAINAELEKLEAAESAKSRVPSTSIDPEKLATWLLGHYPEASRSKTGHYNWMHELLGQLGVFTFDDLENTLKNVDTEAVAAGLDYRYPVGAVRRLDDDLLQALGRDYLAAPHNEKRSQVLETRLHKLRSGSS